MSNTRHPKVGGFGRPNLMVAELRLNRVMLAETRERARLGRKAAANPTFDEASASTGAEAGGAA